ncbi:MAG: hypothetical protein J6B47_01980, partial [Prevotella sp.]|nr:hypothetical protein [Prevotella sp.]
LKITGNPGSEDLYPEFENSGVRRFMFLRTEKCILAYAAGNFGVRGNVFWRTPQNKAAYAKILKP